MHLQPEMGLLSLEIVGQHVLRSMSISARFTMAKNTQLRLSRLAGLSCKKDLKMPWRLFRPVYNNTLLDMLCLFDD